MAFFSIRHTLPVLIVTPILATVALSGFFSYTNGRRSVQILAVDISEGATRSIYQYVGAVLARPQMQLRSFIVGYDEGDLTDTPAMIQALWELTQKPGLVGNIYFGTPTGDFLGILEWDGQPTLQRRDETTAPMRTIYALNAQGQPEQVLESGVYDPRERPWYQKVVGLEQPNSTWSPVYTYASTEDLGITAAEGLYREDGSLFAVFGIDVALTDLQDFLQELDVSPSGDAFILERDGAVVATSTEESMAVPQGDGLVGRVMATDLADPDHGALMAVLLDHYEGSWENVVAQSFLTLEVAGVRRFVGVEPFQDRYGLDWILVVVIPETDFQNIILANIRSTIWVGFILSLAAIAIGLAVARWIVRPIEGLNNAAIAIENNRFQPFTLDSIAQRRDELGTLTQVFQRMGTVISASQASLKEQMGQLEAEMAQAKRQSQAQKGGYTVAMIEELVGRSRSLRALLTEDQAVDLPSLLHTVPYFQSLDPEDLQALINRGYRRTLPARTLVFREEEAGDSFFVILKGEVEIYVEKIDKFLTTLRAGAFFGELSLLLGISRTATVRTTTQSTFFVLDQEGLRFLLQQHPGVGEHIAQALHVHQAELESRKDLLMADEQEAAQFTENPLAWIRGRMGQLFGFGSQELS
ncbi:MAG: HAMP domain-containing protein [Spirulina sp. DLM2.Bin59]|nr:MAG: HAMP domain-containing protein [Spirulina sp. DLM2.Bin59]